MTSRDELIDRLVQELPATTRRPAVGGMAALWLLVSLCYVVAVTALVGPLRPGALQQVAESPHYLLEMLLGAAAITGLGIALFFAAVPGALGRWGLSAVLVLPLLWLATLALGLEYPALHSGMAGKRDHCYLEAMLYALPPLALALYGQRRLYPLHPAMCALFAGLAAGLLPAWYMQLACMHDASHALAFHVLPGLLMVPLALLFARRIILRRAS